MEIKIGWSGSELVIADKPHGMLTVPSRLGAEDPRPCLGRLLEAQLGVRLFPTHRLDEVVSGVVLFALTPRAHKLANRWFEQHQVRKVYEAYAEGVTMAPDTQVTWQSLLVRGKKRAFEAAHGKPAETLAHYLGPVICNGRTYSRWSLSPITGRSHQLRFEMAKHQHAIIGDTLYGSSVQCKIPGAIALRAVALNFSGCAEAKQFKLPDVVQVPDLPLQQLV